MNDIMFHILLLMVINFVFLAKIFDIETAFLYRNLKKELYMECPQGMNNVGKDDCISMDKCIYGLIQILKKVLFNEGNIDSCLCVKKSKENVVYIALDIDDNLMVGNTEAIDEVIEALQENGPVFKVIEGLQNDLSFKVSFSSNKKRA